MELSPLILALAILCGAVAGFINTLAGSGSLVTLPMLIFMGLPPTVANGTNRIGVIFQNIVGMSKFHKSGHLDLDMSKPLIIPMILGAIVGSLIAVDLDEQMMTHAIAGVMILMLGVILMKPKQWLREQADSSGKPKGPLTSLLFFVIGVYGGFIQAGVGVFLLAGMVLRCGFTVVQSNGIKLLLVLVFSVPALILFQINGQVHWPLGCLMAVGQGAGAWLAAHFAAKSENAPIWIRRLLIAVILGSILKLTGLLPSFT